MIRYVFKRILLIIPVIICVSFIIFVLMDLTPGTIVDSKISEGMTQEDIDALMAKYGLDKPVVIRYGRYMFNLVQGDLGVSDVSGISVWDTYITRLPNTLMLSLAALVIGSAISIPLGIFAARHAGRLSDTATTAFTLVGMSMPGFWLGLLLLIVFSYKLGWLPAGGKEHGVRSFILPAVCSGLMMMAASTRQTRSSMLDVLNADFMRTARAKGVPEETVIRKHALGNALIPILTVIGSSLSLSLSGSAVVESVFSWPGVGRAMVDAVNARDVTATCGLAIMSTILYVIMILLVDLMYAFVDPRIKSQYVSAGKKKKRETQGAATKAAPPPQSKSAAFGTAAASSETNKADAPAVPGGSVGSAADNGAAKTTLHREDSGPAEDKYETVSQSSETPAPGAIMAARADGKPQPLTSQPSQLTAREQVKNENAAAKRESSGKTIELIMKEYKKRSQLGEIFHRIRQNKSAMAGLIILCLLLLTFFCSLFISYESVTTMHPMDRLASPSWRLPFGADLTGRNSFLRVVFGSRYSLIIGFGSVGIATIVGVALGSIAGYYGKFTEDLIMRASDVLSSIPGILLGMVIVTSLGKSLLTLIIAVSVTSVPHFIRISRASVLTVRNQEFVEASRAIGLPQLRIIFTQVLPNALSPIIVTFTASLGMAILVSASLSFLGFGIPVPHPEWGALVSEGRSYIRAAPHLTTFPGLFIMITVLAFNLMGDGLRDALDPKLKR